MDDVVMVYSLVCADARPQGNNNDNNHGCGRLV